MRDQCWSENVFILKVSTEQRDEATEWQCCEAGDIMVFNLVNTTLRFVAQSV